MPSQRTKTTLQRGPRSSATGAHGQDNGEKKPQISSSSMRHRRDVHTFGDAVDDNPEASNEADVEIAERPATDTGAKDDRFYHTWDKFTKKPPPPVQSRIANLDENVDGEHTRAAGRNADGLASRENTATTFEEAAETCRKKVRAIVAECRKLNKKYHDPLFDLNYAREDCLVSLSGMVKGDKPFLTNDGPMPAVADVKRVADIFDDPCFFADEGPIIDEVKQGGLGNCWFLASVTALLGMPECIKRVCVDRDEQVSVYGFCFHRDGEWVSSVVDDTLCLKYHQNQRHTLLSENPDETTITSRLPKSFKERIPKGADALYFASCKDSDQTWLPLIEKAYAKVHLSYQAIAGGIAGEGIEDLTGGVNSSIRSEDVLDKDRLWSELLQVNKDFLFGCGSRQALYEDQTQQESGGVVSGHAYTVLAAREIRYKPRKPNKAKRSADLGEHHGKHSKIDHAEKTVRLLKLRNPWGSSKWTGAWSDGSEQWTPETMKELDHTFGDDGIFWISLDDFLNSFPDIDRTRLFGPEWTLAQQWTTVSVPRTIDYSDTNYLPTVFKVHVTQAGPVNFLLSKPDDRYFSALKGRYTFELHFKLFKEDNNEYVVRSMSSTASGRSVSAELECEPGCYIVRMKLTPWRFDSRLTPAEIVKEADRYGREKILSVGKMFDLAHSRGRLREVEIAEAKKIKDHLKRENDVKLRATRTFRKELRRRDKLSKQRIANKEKAILAKKQARQNRIALAPPMDDTEEEKPANIKLVNKSGDCVEIPLAIAQAAELSLRIKDSTNIGSEIAKTLGIKLPSGSMSDAVEVGSQVAEPGEESKDDHAEPGGGPTPTDSADVKSWYQQPTPLPDEQAPGDDQTPAVVEKQESIVEKQDGVGEEQAPAETFVNEEVPNLDETASEFGSVADDDFSWDSQIDSSLDGSDYGVPSDDSDSDPDDGDEWFALATVGLRIYSKESNVSIEVEHVEETEEGLAKGNTMQTM